MKVQRLAISNYRGFTKLHLEFGLQITVLAGVNGSGKSAILRALAALLSHALREVGVSSERPESLSHSDIHKVRRSKMRTQQRPSAPEIPPLTLDATFTLESGLFHAQLTRAMSDPSRAEEYARRRDAARFAIRETKRGSKEEKKLKEDIRFLSELLDSDRDHFSRQVESEKGSLTHTSQGTHPIAVLYATSRYLGRLAPRLSDVHAFEPANAYVDALSGAEVSLAAFANWFNAVQKGALGSEAVSKRIQGLLNKVVKAMLPGFSDPRLADSTPPRFFVKKGKEEFELHQLSDGERGLLALAFDLTRRLAIANPSLKNPVEEAEAIVLLDEVELHLHPSWQRKVLERLMRTFKNCQFIATTHSPQVLGEAPPKSVWMLEAQAGQISAWQPDRFYGLDSNRLLEELMGTDSLNVRVKNRLQKISELVDEDKFKDAEDAIAALEPKLGADHPELIRLRSLIAFVTRKK